MKKTYLEEREGCESLKTKELTLSKDIYSMAYAAMIDPDLLEASTKGGYLPKIEMNQNEIDNLWNGAIMVIFIQLMMVGLIFNVELNDPNFHIATPKSIIELIPRLLSSMMMHLNVEPDIRSGLVKMKYLVNHPHKFRNVYKDDKLADSMSLIQPFLLGFFQTMVAIVVEMLVMIYLASLTNLLDIIMKFVTMAAIVRFDDMYAAALKETKMQDALGKKLPTEVKRYMRNDDAEEQHTDSD